MEKLSVVIIAVLIIIFLGWYSWYYGYMTYFDLPPPDSKKEKLCPCLLPAALLAL